MIVIPASAVLIDKKNLFTQYTMEQKARENNGGESSMT